MKEKQCPSLKFFLTIVFLFSYFICIPFTSLFAAIITHGPRIGLVTSSEATIYWDTDVSTIGKIQYGTSSSYGYSQDETTARTNHRITIEGLSPETTYYFKAVSDDTQSESTLTTAPTRQDAIFKFVTMGDNRGKSDQNDIQGLPVFFTDLLSDMEKRNPAFAFNIGDLFYGYTPDINKMRQLYASFKRATDPLAKEIPYLVSPGGHEMSPYNSTDPQPGFDPLALWNEQFAQPNVLNGHEGTVYSWDWGNTHFSSIDSDLYEHGKPSEGLCVIDDAQIEWLENDLTQAQKKGVRHIFVLSHCHAFRQTGAQLFNQGSVNPVQRDKFWAVLEKYNVNAYITGHEHRFIDTLAQAGGEGSNIDFKVIQWLNGNCGFDADPVTGKHEYTLWTVAGDTVKAELIDTSGTISLMKTFLSRQPVTTPTLDIKANGQDGPLTVSSGTPISITASLAPGNENGKLADWWIAESTPWGLYTLTSSGWSPGINMLAQYPLISISPVEIFNGSLPVGDYAFYFAVDMSPNGVLDSPFYYDFVQVHVVN